MSFTFTSPPLLHPNPKPTSPNPTHSKSLTHLLQHCSNLSEIKQLHTHLIKATLSSKHLISLCLKTPSSDAIDYATLLFFHSPNPTVFSRNNIIKSFSESENPEKALTFYSSTHEKNSPINNYTFPALLKACLQIKEGEQIHTHVLKTGFESDIYVGNTLIHFYSCCGLVENARKVFDKMLERDVVTWNSMITGYFQNGFSEEALDLFRKMQVDGPNPDGVTMVSVLSACANAGAFELGKWVHAYIERNRLDSKISVKTALIDMYSKCGCIEKALDVFEGISKKNLVCWTAMINGLAINGCGRKAIGLFDRMVASNVKPDEISLVSVLSACSHSGLLDEGRKLFDDMQNCYGIKPQMEHYGCMVDLLSRSGLLDETYEFIKKMSLAPNAVIWRTLLGACKVYKRVELGETVLKEILKLEPHHHGDYVLLSNIYAAAGRQEDVVNLRKTMKKKRITKIPGCSTIEVKNQIHSFIVEDKSHRHSKEIHRMLDQLEKKLQLAGYVPEVSKLLIDMDKEEKENVLGHHSEKVAVAFGLIRTTPGTTLRIVKNLRICNDCHSAMNLISKIYAREIIIRDRNRFHHFKEGSCSCGEYW